MNFSSQKSEDEQFSTLLNEIDELLEQYDPGELHPDHILGELIQYRAAQRPLFEQAIHLCTEGLNRFPRNGELLSRRGYAYARVVTDEMEYLLITEADQDL